MYIPDNFDSNMNQTGNMYNAIHETNFVLHSITY